MNTNMLNFERLICGIVRWIFISLTVSGCATISPPPTSMSDAAPLPSYFAGTTFIYSDGNWETVIESSPETVTWRDYRNYVSTGSRDFTHRRTKWETKTSSGIRRFEPRGDLLIKSDITLWPLRAGNIAHFSEKGTRTGKDGVETTYRTEWSCEVPGIERVSVMAGDFETWKIVCKRYYVSKSKSRSNLREVKTWFYAPEVGHYVLTTSKYYYRQNPKRQELLAVLPPLDEISPEARLKMDRSFQTALEFNKRGETVRWSNQKSGISGEILASHTFKTPDGRYYRRYIQKLKLPDGHRTYYGMAVRSSDGVWTIPRR